MRSFAFTGDDSAYSISQLSKPVERISFECSKDVGVNSIILWHSDRIGIRVRSRMHDIGERLEVGVLEFDWVSEPNQGWQYAELPVACKNGATVSKLIVAEAGITADSGVALKLGDGTEIIIVAGAFPYSLAVCGLPSIPCLFDPEYPIDRYSRVEIVKGQ